MIIPCWVHESPLGMLRLVALSDPGYRFFLDRLVEARRAAGLTQRDVAERLGKPQSYVSKCETGERRVDVIELDQLSAIYGRPLDWFVPPRQREAAAGR